MLNVSLCNQDRDDGHRGQHQTPKSNVQAIRGDSR